VSWRAPTFLAMIADSTPLAMEAAATRAALPTALTSIAAVPRTIHQIPRTALLATPPMQVLHAKLVASRWMNRERVPWRTQPRPQAHAVFLVSMNVTRAGTASSTTITTMAPTDGASLQSPEILGVPATSLALLSVRQNRLPI